KSLVCPLWVPLILEGLVPLLASHFAFLHTLPQMHSIHYSQAEDLACPLSQLNPQYSQHNYFLYYQSQYYHNQYPFDLMKLVQQAYWAECPSLLFHLTSKPPCSSQKTERPGWAPLLAPQCPPVALHLFPVTSYGRSEERRVGKE